MPHQLLLKYLSSKTNFVFNQTLYTLFREICRNGTFKRLLKTLLKELFTNKGEILSCKSVKPCKNRKNSRAYYVRTRDKSGSNSLPFKRNVQIPPSPGMMHSQMPGVCPEGELKFRIDRRIRNKDNIKGHLSLAAVSTPDHFVRISYITRVATDVCSKLSPRLYYITFMTSLLFRMSRANMQ